MAAVTAAAEGRRIAYLGPSLPAREIAAAAVRSGAQAVALSLVMEGEQDKVVRELRSLAGALPPAVRVLVGGRSAGEYAEVMSEMGFALVLDMRGLRSELDTLIPLGVVEHIRAWGIGVRASAPEQRGIPTDTDPATRNSSACSHSDQ
jgi:hypothetical protein